MKKGSQGVKRCFSFLLGFVMLLSMLSPYVPVGTAASSYLPGGTNRNPNRSGNSMIDLNKEYILYSLHTDCGNWFAAKADGSLLSLGSELDFPADTGGLNWRFEYLSDNVYRVSNGGIYLSISDGTLVLSEEPASVFLIESGDGFYLADKNGEYVICAGYSGSHRLVVLKKTDAAARPFYIEEVKKPADDRFHGLSGLLPQENFKAVITSPTGVTADSLVVIFAKGEDGNYYAINAAGDVSRALKVPDVIEEGKNIKSPDPDVLWSVVGRTGGNYTADEGPAPLQRYFRSAVQKNGNYLVAGNNGNLISTLYSDSNLNAVTNEDGLSFQLISDDNDEGTNKYVVLKNGEFTVSDDAENATAFYFARLMRDELQNTDTVAEVPEGTLLKIVDWSDVKFDGKTRYALILASEFNYIHYVLTGKGRYNETGAVNITDDWDGHAEDVDSVSLRTTEICPFEIGDYIHTVSGNEILWTIVERNGRFAFKNAGTGLYIAPDSGVNKSQTPAISELMTLLTVESGSGNVIYLGKNGNYVDLWKYLAVSSVKDDVTSAFFIAEVVGGDEKPSTESKEGGEDDRFFGGANSVFQSSQHTLGDGGWWGTGVNAFLMMHPGSGDFFPNADGSNFDITFCIDHEADMPVNIEDLVHYKRVNIDDDETNDAYGIYTKEQRVKLKAIAPKAYPYVSVDQMLQAMEKAGFTVSPYCGEDEMLTGFQAAIYNITNPITDDEGNETGELWGYFGSDMQHNQYEFNRSDRYVADPSIAASDVNTVRDYLLSLAEKSLTETLASGFPGHMKPSEGDLPHEYFALVYNHNGEVYALTYDGYYSNPISPNLYLHSDPSQLWYEDENGYIRSAYDERILQVSYARQITPGEKGADPTVYSTNISYFMDDVLYESYVEPDAYYGRVYVYEYFPLTLDSDGLLRTVNADSYVAQNDVPDELKDVLTPEQLAAILEETYRTQYLEQYYSYSYRLTTYQDSAIKFRKEYFQKSDRIPYSLDQYNAVITENADGTYTVTVTGTLNQMIVGEDLVRLWLIAENDTTRLMASAFVEKGTDQIQLTLSGIAADMEYTFAISFLIPDYDVYLYYDEAPGWVTTRYQTQLGVWYYSSYVEYFHDTVSIPVEKVWTDGNTDHEPVQAELLDDEGNVVKTITLSKENDWKGEFTHIPNRIWTYRMYNFNVYNGSPADRDYIPGGMGKIELGRFRYTVNEPDVEAYLPSYEKTPEYHKVDAKSFPTAGLSAAVHIVVDPENELVLSLNPYFGEYYESVYNLEPYAPNASSQLAMLDGSLLFGVYLYDASEQDISFSPMLVRPYGEDKFVLWMPDYNNPARELYLAFDKDNYGLAYLVEDIEDALKVELWYTQSITGEGNPSPAPGDRGVLSFNLGEMEIEYGFDGDWVIVPGNYDSYVSAYPSFVMLAELLEYMNSGYETENDIFEYLTWFIAEDGTVSFEHAMPYDPSAIFRGKLMVCLVEREYSEGEYEIAPEKTYEMFFISDEDADRPFMNGYWYYDDDDNEFYVTEKVTPLSAFVLQNGKLRSEIDGRPVYVAMNMDDDYYRYGDMFKLVEDAAEALPFTFMTYTFEEVSSSWIITNEPAGDLVVKKTVSGNDGDTEKGFLFTVTLSGTYTGDDGLTHDASEINGLYGEMMFENGTATFTLKHGESIYARDLPPGLTYTVTESDNAGYRVTVTGDITSNGGSGQVPEKGKNNAFVYFDNYKDDVPAGNLTVTKLVNGTAKDTEKEFNFKVTLSGKYIGSDGMEHDASEINGLYGEMEFKDGIANFALKHGERKKAIGLPAGLVYTVTESDDDGYDTSMRDETGFIVENKTAIAIFVNHKDIPCSQKKGSLTVGKMVSGSAANMAQEFPFTVTLSDLTINGTYGDMTFENGVADFTLKHGEVKTATGLPLGITYSVAETDNIDYRVTAAGEEGTISSDRPAVAVFVNNKCDRKTETEEPTKTPDPTPVPTPEKPGTNPGTGDNGGFLILLPVIAVLLLCIYLLVRKTNTREEKRGN